MAGPNPYAQYANPYAIYATPGAGAKPPSGFDKPGAAPVAPLAGGPDDLRYVGQKAAIEAAANAAAQTGKDISVARATAPIDVSKSIQTEIGKLQLQANPNMGARLSPETRDKAISGYNSAQLLDRQIADIEAAYKAGPGATAGVRGLADYLPYTVNKQFDSAGNAARGLVGQALGFTGGQLNTEKEAETAVGPYLPNSSDRDAVILDKIQRLKELRDQAGSRAVSQLGGVPDANGNIRPITAGVTPWIAGSVPPAASPPSGSGGGGGSATPPSTGGLPGATIATGAFKTTADPATSALIDGMIRAGANADEINGIIGKRGYTGVPIKQSDVVGLQTFLKANPNYKGSLADATRQEGTTAFNRVAASPAGAFAANLFDQAGAGLPHTIMGNQGALADQAALNPKSAFWGGLTGNIAGAAGTEVGLGALGGGANALTRALARPLTADVAFGAASGATSNPQDPLLGAAIGGTSGGGGGMFGRGLTRGVGAVAQGVSDPAVQYLRARGIPLTAGQALSQSGRAGNAVKGIEDRLSGLPVIGDAVNARRNEGLDAFGRTAFNDASAPLAQQANPLNLRTSDTGALGIEQLRDIRGQGYTNTYANRAAVADPQFGSDYTNSVAAAGALPNTGPQVADEIRAIVPDYFSGPNATGAITGENAAAAIRELKGLRSARQGDALGYRTGSAIRGTEGSLTGLFDRQAPGFTNDLAQANATNTNLKVLEDAVKAAKNTDERFLPSQLNTASVRSANNFGGTGATTQRPFYDLAMAGQRVLPSKVPDSGTAGRLATLALPAALGGAGSGAGYLAGDTGTGTEAGLGVGALLALGGTRGGQQVLTRLLLDRPDLLRSLGAGVTNRARIGGMFGAGGGALLPSLAQ
jgi:hypothetical protein